MSKEQDINKLKWIRIVIPSLIPRYLVEQIRDRDYSVDDFYKFQEFSCLSEDGGPLCPNPFSHLYVMVNEENITKGFLWFVIDPLTKDITIQTYSVDKEYWNTGKAVGKVADFIKEFRLKGELKRIYWITNYPKHSKRYGFKQSKSVLMEYVGEE